MSGERDKWGRLIAKRNANQTAYNRRHREAINARLAIKRADPEWRAKHRAYQRKLYALNKERHKDAQLRIRYGLSLEEFRSLVRDQGGKCAICDQVPEPVLKPNGKKGTLCVDHDHETGQVRGLLCESCNRAIGLMRDSVERLSRAAMYLSRARRDRESA